MAMATVMFMMATVILIMMMATIISTVMDVQRASATYAIPNGEHQGMTPHNDHDHKKSNSITS